jgi:hypothetical protein
MKNAQIPPSVGFSKTGGIVRPLNHVEKMAQIKAFARAWHIPYREMVEIMKEKRD